MTDLVIDFNNPLQKQALYGILKGLSGEQVIKIKKRSKGRSLQENKYYWKVVIGYISEFTGEDPTYLHEVYKHRHIPKVKFIDEARLTTTDMTHEEVWGYIDMVRMDAKITLGLEIPDPDGVIL